MPQRKFYQKVPKFKNEIVEVMAGWDRPLQCYFCTIFCGEDQEGEDVVLFDWMGMDLNKIKNAFTLCGIVPPETLFDDMEDDKKKGHYFDIYEYNTMEDVG